MAGQENGGTDQFAWLAKAPHGHVVPNGSGALSGCAIGVEEQFAILLARKKTWCNRIDADAFGGPFTSQECGEAEHRRLCRRISDNSREGHMSRNTGDIYNAA